MRELKPVVVPEGMPRMRSAIRPRVRSGSTDIMADLKAVPEKHVGDMHPTLKDQLRTSSISGDSAWAAIARQRAAKAGAASSIVPLVKAKAVDPGLDALIAISSAEQGGGAYPTEPAQSALSPVCVVCSENCEGCRVAPDGQGHVPSGGAAGVERQDSQKDPFQKAERHPDCGHWFHVHCSEGLRRYGVTQACLICRSNLMPGPERLFEEATLRYWRIVRRIEMGELGWNDLPQSLEDEVTHAAIRENIFALSLHPQQNNTPNVLSPRPTQPTQAKAIEDLYLEAASRGHSNAANALGQIYGSGMGLPMDKGKAETFWKMAANQGNNPRAQCCLGVLYQSQGDHQQSLQYFLRAANQGESQSQCNLGIAYLSGRGVEADPSTALMWFTRAAHQGHVQAMYNLGVCYANGKAGERDLVKAMQYMKMAANSGHAQAAQSFQAMQQHVLQVQAAQRAQAMQPNPNLGPGQQTSGPVQTGDSIDSRMSSVTSADMGSPKNEGANRPRATPLERAALERDERARAHAALNAPAGAHPGAYGSGTPTGQAGAVLTEQSIVSELTPDSAARGIDATGKAFGSGVLTGLHDDDAIQRREQQLHQTAAAYFARQHYTRRNSEPVVSVVQLDQAAGARPDPRRGRDREPVGMPPTALNPTIKDTQLLASPPAAGRELDRAN